MPARPFAINRTTRPRPFTRTSPRAYETWLARTDRGRDAVELSRGATFEEVASLLWSGATEGAADFFPWLARGWRTVETTDDLRAALILCADHELNASAFTARVVAATDAPLPNSLLAALCALEGSPSLQC
jgi:citrate synthase